MPILKKTSFLQNLDQVTVFITDTSPLSQYFQISDLPDTFSGGKNAFLIQGSPQLVPDTLVKLEIKDANGKVIYSEPASGIPSYYEGTSKVVSVHIYPDTAFGPCTITILGELSQYVVDGLNLPIPANWEGKYNVKWQTTVNVNPFLKNTTPIRFYRRPKIEITESVLPIYSRTVTSKTSNGYINGTSIIPIQDTDYKTYKGNIAYELSTTSSFFSQSMEGFDINISGLLRPYIPKITDVINDKKALVNIPYYITSSTSDPNYQRIKNFTNVPFSITYDESVALSDSNINTSFAKIKISDLETFTGDAARIKVFATSKNDIAGYQLLEDVLLESNELLQVDEFNGALNVRTGIFSQPILDNYWLLKDITTSVTSEIDNSLLIKSVKLTPTTDVQNSLNLQGLFKFETSASIQFSKFTQYQLDFTPLMSASLGYALLEVYGSGSAFVNSDNTKKFGKLIGEVETNYPFRRYDKQQINFQPDNDGDGKIVFLVKGGTWQISNVSLRAAQESSFSPNEISLVVNVPTKINNETFDFKFEIYDINNNYVPILLESSSTFTGGNDVAVTRDLQLNLSNNYFNFSTASVVPAFITVDFTKNGLSGSVSFQSSAFDLIGNPITSQPGYPGALEVVDSDTYKLTAASFTGSISGVTVGSITYTASCEDVNRYFTIFRTDQGAPAYLFYATADKNNFTFNPDDNYKSVIQNDYIDIRLVQQNLPDTAPMGLVISSGSEVGVPPPLYYTSSLGNASIYRLFVSTSSDTTPSNKSGYTYSIGQSHYDFQLNTIDGVFTSSVTIDAIQRGSAAKALIATSDKNQFTYKMSNLTADPSPQTATILVKRQNLLSPSSSITVNSGSGKPALTLVSNNIGNGVAQYTLSTTTFTYSTGTTTYYFTGSDANNTEYTSEISISPIVSKAAIAVAATNENATLAAQSTGFVPSASFLATSGSLLVTVGNETASYSKTLTTNTYSASISASSGVLGATIVSGTYSVGSLTADSGSVTLAVAYQDGTGTTSTFSKIITYSKAKKAAPVLTFNITNNNQSINAKSTGTQLSEFASASLSVTESYDGVNTTKTIVGSPTITTLYGYSNYFYNSTNQTIALRTLSSDIEQLNITANVVDSENITRPVFGSISLSKVRNAVPNVEVSLVPVAQTIVANSRGSGSAVPIAIEVSASEGGTNRLTSIGTLSFTNGLSGTAAGGVLTFTSNASSMSRDSGSVTIPITYTDSEGSVGTKTLRATVTRVKSAAPITNISVSPQSQTVTSGSSGYATPQNVILTLIEPGGNAYTYATPLSTTINTFSASVVNASINTSTGVITPDTPTTTLGTNASSKVSYINSEGTLLTASVSFSVGVAIRGDDGGQGPGVVYRGTYSAGTAYYHTILRRDIVQYSGNYYIANNTSKNGLTTWGTPGVSDWTSVGATFDSVATNILLTADATITRGLVMGTLSGFDGFIRSANAVSLTGGKGYYFNYDGSFRFGDTGSSVVTWDGTNLTVSGTIKAQTGSIGGVTMSANSIFAGTGNYNNINTGFFLSSSGHFSLEDKLSWDPVNNYLNVSGTITATTGSIGGVTMSNAAIFAGAGLWNDKNTGFFISRSGHFSLEDKLTWDPTTENLNISGTLRASTGSLGGWTIDSDSIFSGTKRSSTYNQFNSASMVTIGSSGYITAPGFYITTAGAGLFSGSLVGNNGVSLTTTGLLQFTQSLNQFTASVTQSLIDASASLSTSIARLDDAIYTNTNGLLDKSLGTMTGKTSGLYTGNEYFGYWNGTNWKSYMDSAGNMVLTGSAGNQGLAWNVSQNALSIDGKLIARSGLIGGWGVGLTQLSSSNVSGGGDDQYTTSGMIIGSTGYISAQNFKIASNGNASFSGSITGGNITIGTAPSVFKADLNGIYLGDGTFASAPFRVTPGGALTATNATITGTVTATDGFIGNWNINTDDISSAGASGGGDGSYTTTGIILNKNGWISSEKFFISSSGEATFGGKIGFGARGAAVNIAPIGMKYDPRDGSLLSLANAENVISLTYTSPNLGANAIDYGLDPFGNNSLLWMSYPSGSPAGNADGGWNSNPFIIDSSKSYKFIVYVKRYQSVSSGAGLTYWGTNAYNESDSNVGLTRVLDGANDTNPYFWYGIPPLLNRWYLIVGYIHGKDYTTPSSTYYGGIYDTVTGEKLNPASLISSPSIIYDYKWPATSKKSLHRAYLYYNTIAGSPYTTKYQEFWGPAVYEIDGSEPDLNELLDKGKSISDGVVSGSFISGSTFFSPKIAGNDGYFSNTFKVGSAGNIVIDGSGQKIYQGTGTYGNTNTGFYLDSTGKFSLKDRLVFDGTNLSIDGTINARSGIFSGSLAAIDGNIGGWIIDGNSLRDSNSNIKLNPNIPSIEIYDTSDVKRLDIKQGTLSNPAGSDTLTIDPPASYAFSSTQYTATSWPGFGTRLYSTSYQTLVVGTSGLYYKATPTWSSDVTSFLSSDSSFDGSVYIELFVEIHSSTTPTTSTLVSSFIIASTTPVNDVSQTRNLTTNNGPVSTTLNSGTYYVFTTWILYGYIAGGSVTLTGTPNPASNSSFALQLDQIEITDNGILVVAGANNYVRMARGTANNTLEVYQNSATYHGIVVNNADNTNTNASGLAIQVTNGSVSFSDKLFIQGMATDPVLANLAIKGVTAAGTRYGELFYSTSTRRNKTDIVDWEKQNILEKIKLVQPKKFVYKNWPSGSEKTLGLIAEDLRDFELEESTVFETDENGNKINDVIGIDWEKVSVILWKGVQELTERIEKLESIISGSI